MIQEEVKAIQTLIDQWRIRVIPCSPIAQQKALEILKRFRSDFGKDGSLIPDSLIIATGMTSKMCIITNEKKWFSIGKELGIKVLSPINLIQNLD